jgi:ribosomal protein S6--L-glutamate ligase
MILSFNPVIDADVQIILGDRSLHDRERALIQKAKAIVLPQGCPGELYQFCSEAGAPHFPNYEMRFKYPGKTGQARLFDDFGFLHPETKCWGSVNDFKAAYSDSNSFPHALPFLVKSDKDHEAEGLFLVDAYKPLSKALTYLETQERAGFSGFVTQALVQADGHVLRAVVMGKNIISYWKKAVKPGQVITTISRGAIIDPHWRPEQQERGRLQAYQFSKKTGINLAAIDFICPPTGRDPQIFFLEINYYFGRRGLGGTVAYYRLFFKAVQAWLIDLGLNPNAVRLV